MKSMLLRDRAECAGERNSPDEIWSAYTVISWFLGYGGVCFAVLLNFPMKYGQSEILSLSSLFWNIFLRTLIFLQHNYLEKGNNF